MADYYADYHRLPTNNWNTSEKENQSSLEEQVLIVPRQASSNACSFRRIFKLVAQLVVAGVMLQYAFRAGWVNGWRTGCGGMRGQAFRKISTGSSLPSHYTLPSGDKIPSVALGVWQASPGEVGNAVKAAIDAGYKHIDGAWIYRNEAEVGEALQESGVNRSDVWLTSKLWNTFHAPEDVEPALDESLAKLKTDYLDLYIIHWPIAFKKGTAEYEPTLTADPYPTWQALEALVEKGKVKNIGVSNFNIARLRNLTANPLKIQPAVNQVELNYFNPQPELLKWSRDHGILLEAYSPLGSNKQVGETLALPIVKQTAETLGITPAQVIISWHVQRGTVVLPKSVTPSRVAENLQITALPDDLFSALEDAATSHPPQRVVNPSKAWGLDFDVFDDYPYEQEVNASVDAARLSKLN